LGRGACAPVFPRKEGKKAAKVAARAHFKKEKIMTMQSVSLSALEASAANPRRKFDRKSIEGLAASIRTDGLLHNLVVSPVKGPKGSNGREERYQIVSGARRFQALKLLEDRGELPEDFTVAVEVRDDLSKDQTLRIATVENLQGQNMTPLEEAAALTKLVHKGVTLDDVVAQTGLSATTIKRRLALNGLCREAKAGLTKGEITLSQAERR
jgi:ParB family transcriptional regulator, chromosome partitioning protein